MPSYHYDAIDSGGHRVHDSLQATNLSEAVSAIEAQGLRIESIADSDALVSTVVVKSATTTAQGWSGPDSSSLQPLMERILQQRETLVPALQALTVELPSGRAKGEAEQLLRQVGEARDPSDLIHSKLVMRWLPLLVTGLSHESSSRHFRDVMAYATRELQTRGERLRLMGYPLIVLTTAVVVICFLCLLVVPTFADVFTDFGMRLPTATRIVLAFTRQIQEHPFQSLLMLAGSATTIYVSIRLWTRYALTTHLFGYAVAGNSAAVGAMSTLTGQLAELLQVGVPLPDALWISGQSCDHYYYKGAAEQLARDAQAGLDPLANSLAAQRFPENVVRALHIHDGQPSIPLLREISAMYAQQVQSRSDWSTGAIAQISIVLIGFAVAFVVIALFMPMLGLVQGLSF